MIKLAKYMDVHVWDLEEIPIAYQKIFEFHMDAETGAMNVTKEPSNGS